MSRSSPLKAAVESKRTEQNVRGANFIGLTGLAHFCWMTPNIPVENLKHWFAGDLSLYHKLVTCIPRRDSLGLGKKIGTCEFSHSGFTDLLIPVSVYNKDNVWGAQNYKLWFPWAFTSHLIGALCLEKEKGYLGYLPCGPALTCVLCLDSTALGHLIQGHTRERKGPPSIDRTSVTGNHSFGGRSQPCRWVVIAKDENQSLSHNFHPWQTSFWARISFQ